MPASHKHSHNHVSQPRTQDIQPSLLSIQDSYYTPSAIKERLKYAKRALQNQERKLSPIGARSFRLYRDSCARLLAIENGDVSELGPEEEVAAAKAIWKETLYTYDQFFQHAPWLIPAPSMEAQKLQDHLISLQKAVFCSRYADIFAGLCIPMKTDLGAKRGDEYWGRMGGKLQLEEDAYPGESTAERAHRQEECPTHLAVSRACARIGLEYNGSMELIRLYTRNEMENTTLIHLIKNNLFDDLKTQLHRDCHNIPLLFDSDDDQQSLEVLESVINAVIDVMFSRHGSDLNDPRRWTGSKALKNFHRQLHTVSWIRRDVMGMIVKKVRKRMRDAEDEEKMLEMLCLTGFLPQPGRQGKRGAGPRGLDGERNWAETMREDWLEIMRAVGANVGCPGAWAANHSGCAPAETHHGLDIDGPKLDSPRSASRRPGAALKNMSELRRRQSTMQQEQSPSICRRMGKECVYRKARRRFNGTKKDLRIEALESKIQQLMSTGSGSPDPQAQTWPAGQLQPPNSGSTPSSDLSEASHTAQPTAVYPPYGGIAAPNSLEVEGGDIIDSGLLSLQTADVLLERFKSTMTPHFPFVVVAPHISAERLRHEKPVLFLSIMTAASYDNMPLQRKLGKLAAETVSSRMLIAGEVTFDLLQGLMVQVAWCQYQPRPRKYSQFLQLAISIIIDLRLDRQIQQQTWKTKMKFDGSDEENGPFKWQSRGPDEQRAVVGCFYLSSTIATLLQKRPWFSHTQAIDDFCRSLSNTAEYETDKYIIYIIQLQLIMEKIDRLDTRHLEELNTSTGSAAELYVTTIQSDLQNFQASLPFPLTENFLLFLHFHTVELYLYQISLFTHPSTFPSPPPPSPPPPSTIPPTFLPLSPARLTLLTSGLQTSSSLFTHFLALPTGTELAFNNSALISLAFALIVSAKQAITALGESAYRATLPQRRMLDMADVLGRMVGRVRAVAGVGVVDGEGDVSAFAHFLRRVAWLRGWYEGHFGRGVEGDVEGTQGGGGGGDGDGDRGLQGAGLLQQGIDGSGGGVGTLSSYPLMLDTSATALDPAGLVQDEMMMADFAQYMQYFPDVTVNQFMNDWMTQPINPF
ncbi:hypothetical protein FQN53_004907 [Emmonsiellopsis sp. PD_33]|nr:hypothetical protein FQN53_004907 [Emmonsiellopsis sp. PD_33]